MQTVQASRTKSMPTSADKLWWRGQVLACLASPTADDGSPKANASATADMLQQLKSLGVQGIWVGEPDLSNPVVRVQAVGVRTLAATPLSPGPPALMGCTSNVLNVVQSGPWFDQEAIAPKVHAALTHLYKVRSHPWPCWLLAAAQGQNETLAQVRKHHLLVAMQLSLKGTCLLPKAIALNAGSLSPHCAHFMVWRHGVPPLVQGSIRLLPIHDNLLMFVREGEGQKVLCAFNPSDRYVRLRLPDGWASARLMAGSGLTGGRLVNQHIDCDPWGALFATVAP